MSSDVHTVLNTPIDGQVPTGYEAAVFGMGCFWGAERIFWRIDGVYTTSAGYSGGSNEAPSYELVCTGTTGHAEVVRVVYHPAKVGFETLLKAFWENHDPTQGNRQGNDVGTQYQSVIFTTTDAQLKTAQESREAFQPVVTSAGLGPITTQIEPLPNFFLAEGYHQQYLDKNPNGYCNHGPNGMSCPIGVAR